MSDHTPSPEQSELLTDQQFLAHRLCHHLFHAVIGDKLEGKIKPFCDDVIPKIFDELAERTPPKAVDGRDVTEGDLKAGISLCHALGTGPEWYQSNEKIVLEHFAAHRHATEQSMRERLEWQPIETAPKDGTDFLSWGGPEGSKIAQPTRWLSPGPYTTENGKNAEGKRRYQWPEGFYWAGYDGFVGAVYPTHWRPLPDTPKALSEIGEHLHE